MIIDYLFKLDDFLSILYSIVLLLSIGYFKRITALTLAAILLLVAEVFMHFMRDPLLAFARSLEQGWTEITWYGTWLLTNLIIIYLFHKMHQTLYITKTKHTNAIIWMIIAASALQVMRFLNSISFNYELVTTVYKFGIPTLNYCMGFYLLIVTLRNIFTRKKRHEISF